MDREKIGVGIVTCGRPELFKKLFESLQPCKEIIDYIAIVEDPRGPNPNYENYITDIIVDNWKGDGSLVGVVSDENMGVAKSKNRLLDILMKEKCDHIFLVEDDIYILNPNVFEKYIETSKITGIQHLNYSQHGLGNKAWPYGDPNPRVVVDYGPITLPLYMHCVGAFSYYTRNCITTVGKMDERYMNAFEHVDHTLSIINADMHPPFWYFADIEKSWEYLGDEPWSIDNSTITSSPHHKDMVQQAEQIFASKFGHTPTQTMDTKMDTLGTKLKNIKYTYGKK